MNRLSIKFAAAACAAALFLGSVCTACAVSTESDAAKIADETQSTEANEAAGADNEDSTESSGSTGESHAVSSAGLTKDETVYILAGADGSAREIIVSDWLNNAGGLSQISDVSILSDIENVKGDETYTAGSGDTIVWDAAGNDIYYQGSSDKELPVALTITYTLDGAQVTPEELLGKSGKLTIRYDYRNNVYEMADIDGKEEKIYVPFAMITGMILDNDVFSNVEVTNGKLTNDGDRMIAIGCAFPGLQENLALDREDYDIPDYFEITADVKDFSLGMAVTIASNEVFSGIDTSKLDEAEELTDSTDDLTDAMEQLKDGASQLYDGIDTLLEKSGDLTDGIAQLYDGAKSLKDGAATLDDGAGELQSGIDSLNTGLSELSDNNEALTGGAKTIFETLLSTANTQLAEAGLSVKKLTIKNYAKVLDGVIASLDEDAVYATAKAKVEAAVEEKRADITTAVTAAVRAQVEEKVTAAVRTQVEEKVTAAVKEQVTAQVTAAVQQQVNAKVTEAVKATVLEKVLTSQGMTVEIYNQAVAAGVLGTAAQQTISATVDALMAGTDVQASIASATAQQMKSDGVLATIASTSEEQMKSETVQAQVSSNTGTQMETDAVKATIKENTDAQMATDEIKKTISDNVDAQVEKAITDAMASDDVQSQLTAASEGLASVVSLKTSLDSYKTFYEGLTTYTEGVQSAADGAASLADGAASLAEGTGALKDGSEELYDGIGELKDGVAALVDGVLQLKDGAGELSDGLVTFDEEGISKITDALGGDLSGLIKRVKATVNVSGNYCNYSGISEDAAGSVSFIYRIDEIKADE